MKKVNHQQLGQLVKLYYKQQDVITKKKLPLIIYGTFGVGKSTIIRDKSIEIAEERKREFIEWNKISRMKKDEVFKNPQKYFMLIDIRLSEFDSSDVKGLPDFTSSDIMSEKTNNKFEDSIEWKIPLWAKYLSMPESDGILFFDEINLACCDGDTKILTNEGFKKIKDIKKEDKVLDKNGKYSSVQATQKTHYKGEMFKVKATGIRELKVTHNHPFLVIEKYRKANKKHNVKQTISKPIWKKAEELKKGDYLGIKIPSQLSNTLKDKDVDFAKLCGMYVANGCLGKNKNSFILDLSYGTYKTKERKEVEKTLKKVFPNKHIGIYERDNCIRYRVTITKEKKIYDYLKDLCGDKAKEKRIPFEILNSSNKKVMLAFLKGYIEGDGCFMKDDNVKSKSKIGIATSSEDLALGLQFMIARLGYLATINKDDKIRTTYIKGRKIVYEGGFILRITNTGFQKLLKLKPILRERETEHYFKHNNILWIKIRDISKKEEFTEVYNFEVKDSNTYTANNILTHNTPLVISSTYKIIHDRVIGESGIDENWLIL